MKRYILKIAQDLEQNIITEDKARNLLLSLFGVNNPQPLTIERVNKMLNDCSKETWIAVNGNDNGWKEWWSN